VDRLRIALLTYSTKPRGGVVHTLALAEGLARAGQAVTVWTLARGGDTSFFRPVDTRVRICAVPFPEVAGEGVGPRVLRSIALLAQAFGAQGEGYDVVHAQDCITANAVPGHLRTVHHIDQFTTAQLAACHERALVEPCAHVCVSESVATELAQGWGRSATVIPNGVEASRFEAAAGDEPEARARRRYWQERFGRFVLAVGGIEPRKGTADLVRAMAGVRHVRPGTRLVVAGGDTLFDYADYRRDVDALAERLGVDPVVLGPVAHPELPGLVAAAGVFAFPSLQEGFGLAAMEALAAGVPVVTRDLPVFREVFDGAVRFADPGDGEADDVAAGLAAELSAALAAPADDPARKISRVVGQALAAKHTWDDAAASHLTLYRRLITQGHPLGIAGAGAPRTGIPSTGTPSTGTPSTGTPSRGNA
jgi:glycosyltransferase-like protein